MMRRSLVASLIAVVGCTGTEESKVQSLASEPSIAEQIENHAVRLTEAEQKLADFIRRNRSRLPETLSEAELQYAELLRRRQAELPGTFSDELPDASELPPGWRPFQFNGLTFYVVPLN